MNTKQILKIRCVYKDILDKIDLRKYVLAEKIISITNHQNHSTDPPNVSFLPALGITLLLSASPQFSSGYHR